MSASRRAVVLLSGGMDSATCLWRAVANGHAPVALSVDYGQRHAREIRSARDLAAACGAPLHELSVRLPWLAVSSLVDSRKRLPDVPLAKIGRGGVPSTYVPARNTVLLSLAASLAESVGAKRIFFGANALDYSGYPDCRPAFTRAFERALDLGTREGGIKIEAPLLRLDKAQIVRLAVRLGVPLSLTWSCYKGGAVPCGRCDSCKLRAKGFAQAGVPDPAR
ncbi:MAG: 7-cyano-7-deazaguanine synthase QueC [Elusimicrobia bacterium]|nr:7-cyano-7-deazaguanine synthase QueC [Elusimicrobiota bacterium]